MSMYIQYPFQFDVRGRTASTGGDAHIRGLIEQILFTNPGERVNRPDFGAGVMRMIFAPNDPATNAAVRFTLQAALQQWLGELIDVQGLDVSSDGDATLTIEVIYSVRRTSEQQAVRVTRPA